MFDLGWTEMLVIGIVALIVIGPKDLPVMFRTVGQFVGKAKGMAREFSRAMNDAANESGVKDVTKGLQAAVNPVNTAMDGVKKAASDLGKFDPESETGKLAAEKKAERAENAKKIQAATARSQAERKLKEAQAAQAKAEELEAQITPPEKSDT